MRAIGTGFKVMVLAMVIVAAAWLVWKSTPPYNGGTHASTAEIDAAATGNSVVEAKAGAGPRIVNCEILPADNVWNTPVDKAKREPKGTAWITSIGPTVKVHPD